MDLIEAAHHTTKARHHIEAIQYTRGEDDAQYHRNQLIWNVQQLWNAGFDIPKPYTRAFLEIGPALVALSAKIDAQNLAAA